MHFTLNCHFFNAGGVISYNGPEGSETAQGLWDSSFDGQRENGEIHGGLGRLVDGETGADNFRLDIGLGKGLYLSLINHSRVTYIPKQKFNMFLSSKFKKVSG